MTNPNSIAAQILSSSCASYWLKDATRSALDRDPVDALADAEALRAAMLDNLQAIQGGR